MPIGYGEGTLEDYAGGGDVGDGAVGGLLGELQGPAGC